MAFCATAPAFAVDGCRVLLCLAGDWQRIAECRGEVRQALRDVSRGRPWPVCTLAGGPAQSASHEWASAPDNCPPQYTEVHAGEEGTRYSCRAAGVVRVRIDGAPWAQVWWDAAGGTATDYSPAARARLGAAIDPTFDADLAGWQAQRAAARD